MGLKRILKKLKRRNMKVATHYDALEVGFSLTKSLGKEAEVVQEETMVVMSKSMDFPT